MTMKVRVALAPAYLLSSRPYSDSSLLLEAFTHDHGRVGLVARAARSAKSRSRGLLQCFAPLLLSWQQSGELGSLTAVESAGPIVPLSGERVFYGWYVNELLLRLMQRQDVHPGLYSAYECCLLALRGDDPEAALRVFEKALLAEIGYGLHLPNTIDAQQRYRYDWELGLQVDHQGYAGSSLIALRDERFDTTEARREARELLQAGLARHLGGRALETPQMLRALRRQMSH